MASKIADMRGNEKLKQLDLSKFYTSKEAVSNGIVDSVDRIYSAMPKISPKANITLLKQTKL